MEESHESVLLLACAAAIGFIWPAALQATDASKHCIMPTDAMRAQVAATTASYEDAEPPLWDNLGSATYPVTTGNPQAQAFFDQGLKLSYGFNHAEARRAFRMAQKLDPKCALCFWGEALVLGPNINVPMMPEAQAPALAALKQAEALAGGASAKEQALIAALAKRYTENPPADRAPLDGAYADAMAALSDANPDDLDTAALAAEAAMDTQPWDYWQPGGHEPKGRAGDAIERVEGILARNPLHAGAIHLYIHLVEASDRPERAEKYADTLAALMPGAGHIVHMPSHIYYRVGRYDDSLTANQKAVKVDEAYLRRPAPSASIRSATPRTTSISCSSRRSCSATRPRCSPPPTSWMAGSATTSPRPSRSPSRSRRLPTSPGPQFADADKLVALPPPAGAPPYVEAMWHYARGVGLAEKGDAAGAAPRPARSRPWRRPRIGRRRISSASRRATYCGSRRTSCWRVRPRRRAIRRRRSLIFRLPPASRSPFLTWSRPIGTIRCVSPLGAALLKAGRAKEAPTSSAPRSRERGRARGPCSDCARRRRRAETRQPNSRRPTPWRRPGAAIPGF